MVTKVAIVYGSHGASLDCMLPWVQFTAGMYFSALNSFTIWRETLVVGKFGKLSAKLPLVK